VDALTYRVTDQIQRSRLRPSGGFEDVMEVYFMTYGGTAGSVTIPLAQYSTELVQRIVSERVAHIEAVAAL